jgi:hypothetical protein
MKFIVNIFKRLFWIIVFLFVIISFPIGLVICGKFYFEVLEFVTEKLRDSIF